MEIYYLGHACFSLRGKTGTVVTDPFEEAMTGLKFPTNTRADIVTVSHQHGDHNATANITGDPLVFDCPGEYEAKGMKLSGIQSFHDAQNGSLRGGNIIFNYLIDGVNIVHCGDLGHKLTAEQIENLPCEILFVPVGGFYTLDAHTAAGVVSQLEPKIVVPMHYRVPGLSPDLKEKLAPVDTFLREMGLDEIEPRTKLTFSAEKLPEKTEVVLFA